MNIFFVDDHPYHAAEMLCDKHVVKMIVETAQLLSTAHHVLDGDKAISGIYKPTHKNHPSAIWARKNSRNYIWLILHLHGLCEEYTFRYGKKHKTETVMLNLNHLPTNITRAKIATEPPLCMPDEYKINTDAIESYRNYYRVGKAHLHTWTKRERPTWL